MAGRNTTVYRVLENGALNQVPGSPYQANDPITVAADPLGRFVYVANENDPIMYSYRVGSNGSLAQLSGSPTPTYGAWIEGMTTDPFGRYVYMLEGVAGFGVFRINSFTGLLELIQNIGVETFSTITQLVWPSARPANSSMKAMPMVYLDPVR